ncbi:MAG: PEP-CTERM sorting domain-containing protein [Terrimicrobiaceae bacterium]
MAALLAIAGLVLGTPPARAVLTAVDGDVLLGFRETVSPQNAFVVNLGQYTQFTNAAPGATLTFGSLSTFGVDLEATFGAGWNTRSDLYWGVFGNYSGNLVSIYASRARTVAGTPATAWGNPSQTVRNNTSGGIDTVKVGFVNTLLTTESGNTTNAGFQIGTGSGRYYAGVNTSPDFSTSSPFNGAGIEGAFSGTKVLDLFALSSSPTVRLGTFTINETSGQVTFTAVPEPSTYMLFAFAGAVFMAFIRRRRALQN